MRNRLPVLVIVLLWAVAGLLAGCGDSDNAGGPTASPEALASASPAPTMDPNCAATPEPGVTEGVLLNSGFEKGRDPWSSLTTPDWGPPFEVSQAQAHTGANSAYLKLRSSDGGVTKVYGVVQELTLAELPEVLSGYYFVETWEQGTPKQYLQFVVIVTGAANIPQEVLDLQANNHQIRYILAGVDEQPTNIANSRYVMVSTEQPAIGQWVRFERNIRRDFCELWGSLPAGFSGIRVLFETRWDERKETDPPSSADVYYDDLSWGPAGGAQ